MAGRNVNESIADLRLPIAECRLRRGVECQVSGVKCEVPSDRCPLTSALICVHPPTRSLRRTGPCSSVVAPTSSGCQVSGVRCQVEEPRSDGVLRPPAPCPRCLCGQFPPIHLRNMRNLRMMRDTRCSSCQAWPLSAIRGSALPSVGHLLFSSCFPFASFRVFRGRSSSPDPRSSAFAEASADRSCGSRVWMLGALRASVVDPLCCLRPLCFLCVGHPSGGARGEGRGAREEKAEVRRQKAKVRRQKAKVEEGSEDDAGASGRCVPTQ